MKGRKIGEFARVQDDVAAFEPLSFIEVVVVGGKSWFQPKTLTYKCWLPTVIPRATEPAERLTRIISMTSLTLSPSRYAADRQ